MGRNSLQSHASPTGVQYPDDFYSWCIDNECLAVGQSKRKSETWSFCDQAVTFKTAIHWPLDDVCRIPVYLVQGSDLCKSKFPHARCIFLEFAWFPEDTDLKFREFFKYCHDNYISYVWSKCGICEITSIVVKVYPFSWKSTVAARLMMVVAMTQAVTGSTFCAMRPAMSPASASPVPPTESPALPPSTLLQVPEAPPMTSIGPFRRMDIFLVFAIVQIKSWS